MPLAALTPVLNDLLHKDGNSSTTYPQQCNSTDMPNTSEYRRKSSVLPTPSSLPSLPIEDVSISFNHI